MTHDQELHFDSFEERADAIIYELESGDRDFELTLFEMLERLDADLLDWTAWVIISEVCVEYPELGRHVASRRERMNEGMPERILNVAKRHTVARKFVFDSEVASTVHDGSHLEVVFQDGSRAVYESEGWRVRLGLPRHQRTPCPPGRVAREDLPHR